jgi:hypothetical protein
MVEENAFLYNQLTSITIGANVTLGYTNDISYHASFGNNFDDFYNAQGRRAGTYTLNNGTWSVK